MREEFAVHEKSISKRAAERQGGCFEKAVERNVVAGGQTAKGD